MIGLIIKVVVIALSVAMTETLATSSMNFPKNQRSMKMSKVVKYGDFFIDTYNKRKSRKMRAEVREQRVKEYIKRAEKGLPLFTEKEEDE